MLTAYQALSPIRLVTLERQHCGYIPVFQVRIRGVECYTEVTELEVGQRGAGKWGADSKSRCLTSEPTVTSCCTNRFHLTAVVPVLIRAGLLRVW